ncbi:uncharacterized protein ASCRUDRAFT_72446 [Ascoidea rubescens DSM 1968]|uniref:Uncharacterized protein n=1 Tax=Ascoidea rubescens DSM 1968 TaxID=1344418 RepID=A0A1D2VA31_9ASCO|nr:hypothetical protein ASCRUDRAFT_72446 [Ascoidea rubescens DSM 1968]ODV58508.1 hypothetical protein ASCRUDRAFT_72446 [Ascoidea rubescens DSM 1968]
MKLYQTDNLSRDSNENSPAKTALFAMLPNPNEIMLPVEDTKIDSKSNADDINNDADELECYNDIINHLHELLPESTSIEIDDSTIINNSCKQLKSVLRSEIHDNNNDTFQAIKRFENSKIISSMI